MLKNILIVDTSMQEMLNLIYRIHNNSTIACTRGEVAYAVCRRWKPDLIICGEMRDMQPWEFSNELLREATMRPLMVAIFHRHENERYQRLRIAKSLENGFDVAVETPLLMSTLLAWADFANLAAFPHELHD